MAEQNGIERMVDRVVAQALESHVPRLREDIVQRVLRELPASSESSGGDSTAAGADDLLKAVRLIHAGSTQREILRALLDSANQYCERTALFVIKAGNATGWQGRGFTDGDAVKDFALDVSSGLCARALQERIVASGSASHIDPVFMEKFGGPRNGDVLVLPLILKDKVAALVYADAGREEGGNFETSAVELLVAATSAWLEVISLRKQAPKESGEQAAPAPVSHVAPPVETTSSFVDPFAGHAPMHAVASVPVEEPVRAHEHPAEAATAVAPADTAPPAEEVPVVSAATAQAPAPVETVAMSPEDADVHRKAQRFAKLLVDEIKLYNHAKVMEGRKNKDLYDRLKEDIEKSRGTYKKRYGNTAAASGDYFINEVIRSLAEDDQSIMGGNFRR
jgi:hypothetical protein